MPVIVETSSDGYIGKVQSTTILNLSDNYTYKVTYQYPDQDGEDQIQTYTLGTSFTTSSLPVYYQKDSLTTMDINLGLVVDNNKLQILPAQPFSLANYVDTIQAGKVYDLEEFLIPEENYLLCIEWTLDSQI